MFGGSKKIRIAEAKLAALTSSNGEAKGGLAMTTTYRWRIVAIFLTVAVAVAAGAGTAGASSAAHQASCAAKFSGGALRLCGPAIAHFRGVTYRKGTCKRTIVAGDPVFVLELGAVKPGSATNGGLSYLKIEIDGPLARPTSGHLISWHGGKRWSGYGQSFKPSYSHGKLVGGTFVVTRTAAGAGRATGSFDCRGR